MDDTIPTITLELHDRIAQYRTALVALLAVVKRDGGYMTWTDQMLLKQIDALLDTDNARVVQTDLDCEKVK